MIITSHASINRKFHRAYYGVRTNQAEMHSVCYPFNSIMFWSIIQQSINLKSVVLLIIFLFKTCSRINCDQTSQLSWIRIKLFNPRAFKGI